MYICISVLSPKKKHTHTIHPLYEYFLSAAGERDGTGLDWAGWPSLTFSNIRTDNQETEQPSRHGTGFRSAGVSVSVAGFLLAPPLLSNRYRPTTNMLYYRYVSWQHLLL